MRSVLRAVATLAVLVLLTGASAALARASARSSDDLPAWRWPLDRFRIAQPYLAPATRYGPGHRGIDLAPLGAPVVLAPAAGTVAYAGRVADRGVLTIDHGGGLVSTFEPVATTLVAGDRVRAGQSIATIGIGGHTAAGALHLGVRRDGEYVNPMTLLGEVPRAVLLPCCAPLADAPQARG